MNTWSIIYCSMKRCYVILFMFQKITNLQHTMGFSLRRSQFIFCCAIHEYVRRTLTCSESQKRISEISTELSRKRHEKLIGAFHLILRVRTLYICVSYSNSTAEHWIGYSEITKSISFVAKDSTRQVSISLFQKRSSQTWKYVNDDACNKGMKT